jgi:MurNAc alpha-1-phosphate uridylyltransferase
MILAAGRGERMRPLTDNMPKPLLPVADKPLIQHHIERLAGAGVREIVINLAWKGAMIRETLRTGAQFGVDIVYSDEGDRALETGGGIFNALPLLGIDPFLIVNGDVWTDYPFEKLIARFECSSLGRGGSDLAHLVLVPNPPQHSVGDFTLSNERVSERGESSLTYSGIGVYSAAFFDGSSPGPFKLLGLLLSAIKAGRLSGERYAGRWFDIGTPQRLGELDAQLRTQRS